MVRRVGFEPTTPALKGRCSTPELPTHINKTQKNGSPTWTRTRNPLINSQMLCQLSYQGTLLLLSSIYIISQIIPFCQGGKGIFFKKNNFFYKKVVFSLDLFIKQGPVDCGTLYLLTKVNMLYPRIFSICFLPRQRGRLR